MNGYSLTGAELACQGKRTPTHRKSGRNKIGYSSRLSRHPAEDTIKKTSQNASKKIM
jgi:hypothetical protein